MKEASIGLQERYARELRERGWNPDSAQLAAVARLELLRGELVARQRHLGLLGRVRRSLGLAQSTGAARGVYLWGGVGRGKTWLMDLFFDSLGTVPRRRRHFHHLMRDVHAGLAAIRDQEEPVRLLARRLARRATVWCLDELQVTDIADAMLLGGLFDELLRQGVTLVITSNVPPSALYRDGLQRARFLPAIELLERQLDVLEVDAGADYRLRQLRRAPVYLISTDPATPARLASLFAELAGMRAESARHIELNGRTLTAYKRAGGVVWFSFANICEGARSAIDYAELAQDFHTVFVTDIPLLTASREDAARRLIILVDEFYDQGVKLVVSAAAPPADLYQGERLSFDFRRTASRLAEMQSEEYLARAHLKSMD